MILHGTALTFIFEHVLLIIHTRFGIFTIWYFTLPLRRILSNEYLVTWRLYTNMHLTYKLAHQWKRNPYFVLPIRRGRSRWYLCVSVCIVVRIRVLWTQGPRKSCVMRFSLCSPWHTDCRVHCGRCSSMKWLYCMLCKRMCLCDISIYFFGTFIYFHRHVIICNTIKQTMN